MRLVSKTTEGAWYVTTVDNLFMKAVRIVNPHAYLKTTGRGPGMRPYVTLKVETYPAKWNCESSGVCG
jgi:hypothetical protein